MVRAQLENFRDGVLATMFRKESACLGHAVWSPPQIQLLHLVASVFWWSCRQQCEKATTSEQPRHPNTNCSYH